MERWLNFPFEGAWLLGLLGFAILAAVVIAAIAAERDTQKWRRDHAALAHSTDVYFAAWNDYREMQQSFVEVCYIVDASDASSEWRKFPRCKAEVALDGSLRIFTLQEPDERGAGYICEKTTVALLKSRQWMEFRSGGPAADVEVAKARGRFGAGC